MIGDTWKGSGNGNDFFSQAPIMKPKLLSSWVLSQVQAPEKASAKFFFSKYSAIYIFMLIILFE